MKIYQVTGSYFCAGLDVRDGIITETVPILKRFKGKRFTELESVARYKKWKVSLINEDDNT